MAWDLERVLSGWESEDSGIAGGLLTNASDPAPALADVARWVRARIAELEAESDVSDTLLQAAEAERDALFALKVDIGKALGGDDPRPFVERVRELRLELKDARSECAYWKHRAIGGCDHEEAVRKVLGEGE